MVQTKFVKYKTLKYFKSITLILCIAIICENCILEVANQSKSVKYRALENNQLYGIKFYSMHTTSAMNIINLIVRLVEGLDK